MTSAKKSLQRDSRLKRTLYSDIEIFGLEELQRAMRGMPKQVQKQVKNGILFQELEHNRFIVIIIKFKYSS